MQRALRSMQGMMSTFADALRPWDFPRRLTAAVLPVFQYTAAVDSVQQFAQTSSAKHWCRQLAHVPPSISRFVWSLGCTKSDADFVSADIMFVLCDSSCCLFLSRGYVDLVHCIIISCNFCAYYVKVILCSSSQQVVALTLLLMCSACVSIRRKRNRNC